MVATVQKYAEAFAKIGWRGPFNIQLRRDADGSFKCHEFGGRTSGSTSARRLMGYDEMRMLMRAFVGRDLGPAIDDDSRSPGFVQKTLTDYFVPTQDVEVLKRTGSWHKR